MSGSTAPTSMSSGLFVDPREDWLAQYTEEIIDPARPIVDPHHHLWQRGGLRYMIEDMADDIASGHNVIATVYVDCRSMYRANGPEAFRPVGEVEFANGVAAMSASGGYGKAQMNAGIVSHANMLLGDAAKGVLEAEIVAGNGRFRGRIWIEDQDFNIVRLNGTYEPRPRTAYFFHLDSWRLNLLPGYWVPAYVYSEEGDFSDGSKDKMAFKAQTRLWGYDLQKGGNSEFTEVLVDSTVKHESPAAQDAPPLQAQWQWQQQAGDNVIERLQNAGLLAPAGTSRPVVDRLYREFAGILQEPAVRDFLDKGGVEPVGSTPAEFAAHIL